MNPKWQAHLDLLGQNVKDTTTGFFGVVTSVAFYNNAEPRACVERLVDGKPAEHWFSVHRLVLS